MEDLPLEVREIDGIEIDKPNGADAGGREIESHGRAQSSRSDQKHSRCLERALPVLPHLRQENVAAIANELFASQLRRVSAPFNIHAGGILRSESSGSSIGR
jgi:hypothetical protein